jgi:UDP-N-acetylglucosamine--N-acetylmuramyl-(pentapeptide) pyrophosphoryl-undecaprenol N-acetylglucosamine transferase
VFAFLDQMHYAYSVADLVVARAGAGCVHEVMRFGLPSVLVPYPHAGQHQLENARVLAEKGAALLLEETRLTPELLSRLLDLFSEDVFRRRTMAAIARSLEETATTMSVAEAVLA